MGHKHVKETTDRVTSEASSPWAKLCGYPKKSPIGECITAVEKTCQNLTLGEADEMRAEIKDAITP